MSKLFKTIAKLIAGIATLAVVFWLYLALFAREPVFGPEQDVELGRQVVQSIEESGDEGPILSREEYPEAYRHMDRLVASLVQSPDIQYRDVFKYDEVRIIHNDRVLNAFCSPGGFIYVYTGLIHYLDAEDHLAGVLGHEIAHAERRHSSLRMQKQYGSDRLFDFTVLTTPISLRSAWALSMLTDLKNLDYSRDQEAEADRDSVHYLSSTDFACDATAGFFEKLTANADGAEIPTFLSDHPSSESRIRDIQKEAEKLGCSTELGDQSNWQSLQAALPPYEPPPVESAMAPAAD
ncbi:MAG: M48 family metalloprotease [Gammaproteobacteria bacterium]